MYEIEKDGKNEPMCRAAKETQIEKTDFCTQWEKVRVG